MPPQRGLRSVPVPPCRHIVYPNNIQKGMENNNINTENEETQLLPLLNLCWAQFRAYWGWFLISAAICLVAGYIYLQRQPRVYQRQAVILIEDANPSAGMGGSSRRGGAMSSLLELNGISVGDNLKNEIFILSSYRLMSRVVDTLGLEVDYTRSEALHSVSLYRNRPFSVEFAGRNRQPESFVAECTGKRTFSLTDFRRNGQAIDGSVSIKAGESKTHPWAPSPCAPTPASTASAPARKSPSAACRTTWPRPTTADASP